MSVESSSMKLIVADAVAERRRRLAALAERMTPGVTVTHQVDSGRETLQLVETVDSHLLLLHSELADMQGIEVLRALPATQRAQVILVTTDSLEAQRAFESGVHDCLLQPVTPEAFVIAMLRARLFLTHSARGTVLVPGRPEHRSVADGDGLLCPPFLVGEREHRLYPIDPNKIDYIESAGNYVKYHIGTSDYIARESVKHLEVQLCALGFLRIERCLLINIRSIAYIEPLGQAIFAFTLVCGAQLHSGPAYRETILQVLPLRRRPSSRGGRRPHPLNGPREWTHRRKARASTDTMPQSPAAR
jgi:two-component system LytT family response regulator